MIKYDSFTSVISPFNPLITLHPQVRKLVNRDFISPILSAFLENLGGIDDFEVLDVDKLKTDVEFKVELNYVNNYFYKEIISSIKRLNDGSVFFKPRYTISFDSDLAGYEISNVHYPYKYIFNNSIIIEQPIRYGLIKLGNTPVLYIIHIELQPLIRYIKKININYPKQESRKIEESDLEKRNRLFITAIQDNIRKLNQAHEPNEKDIYNSEINRLSDLLSKPLQGASGKIRINLAWSTIDDLDLFVETPKGTVNYLNKVIVNQDIILELDIDRNADELLTNNPQENIIWHGLPDGDYKVGVDFYKSRENSRVQFSVTILVDENEGRIYNSFVDIIELKTRIIANINLHSNNIIFTDFLG